MDDKFRRAYPSTPDSFDRRMRQTLAALPRRGKRWCALHRGRRAGGDAGAGRAGLRLQPVHAAASSLLRNKAQP